MKSISLKLFGAAALIAAALTTSAQNSETRKVSDFHSIGVAGYFNVHVKIDGQESLKLSGPADVLKEIETEVKEKGTLEIHFREGYKRENNNQRVDVYISAKSLSSLSVAGAVKLDVEGALTGEKVKISTAGVANITTAVKATSVEASSSGSSDVTLSGTANSAKYSLSGAGKLNATELKSEEVKISIAGAGGASVFANKTISASIAGSGHIKYRGNATIEHYSSAGSGSITKEKGEE